MNAESYNSTLKHAMGVLGKLRYKRIYNKLDYKN